MADIEKQLHINAPIERVWAALTDPAAIGAWMHDDTIIADVRVGGSYAIFGGDTTGSFNEIAVPGKLEYTWRQASWSVKWADSIVRWELKPDSSGTWVHLTHKSFPNKDERDSHNDAWDLYWLEPMQDWLESEAQALRQNNQ